MRIFLAILSFVTLFAIADAEEEGIGDFFSSATDTVVGAVKSLADRIKGVATKLKDTLPWEKLETVTDSIDYLENLVFPDQVWPEDVDHWVPLTDRLILGLDKGNKAMAIYDLAIPNPFSPKQIARMGLGVVGVGDINLRTIIEELEELIDTVGVSRAPTIIKDAIDLLGDIKKESGTVTDKLNPNWTSKLQFNNKKRGLQDLQQGNIDLANLDFKNMLGSASGQLESALKEAQKILKTITGIDFGPNLLSQFELKKQASGGFEIGMKALDTLSETNINFCKVTDFTYPSLNKVWVLGFLGTQVLLSKAVRLLDAKVPPLGTILSVVVAKFFRMLDEQQSYYRHMLWEHLNNLQYENGIIDALKKQYSGAALETRIKDAFSKSFGPRYVRSPLSTSLITSSDKDKMATYLITRWPGLVGQITTFLDQDDWEDVYDDDRNYLTGSLAEMDKRHTPVQRLNNWHTVYRKDGAGSAWDDHTIVTNARAAVNVADARIGRVPLTAVHRKMSDRAAARLNRNLVELYWTVLKFNPDPISEFIISTIYDFFINFQAVRDKGYEHRLASHLHWRQYSQGEDWTKDIDIIYDKRVNPFLLYRTEEDELLQLRWSHWFPTCPTCNIQPGCSLKTTTKICCDVTCP